MSILASAGEPRERDASLREWVSVFGCMLGALVAVLDIQITNSSLPDIEGGIGTGRENGTWISTAYLIGEIIMIPLTDYLSRVFTVRRLLLTCVSLFLCFSVACAFATNIGEMILLRGMQGFWGGAIIPMAFARVLSVLPKHQQPAGLAAFALTATFGPSIGPSIGGFLTENYGWQFIFLVNLLPGGITLALLVPTLERQVMNLLLLREGDWWGIGFMIVGLACLQTALDEGNANDWFGSPLIVRLTIIAVATLSIFIVIELRGANPVVQLRLLAYRNFALGTIANVALGIALFGSVYVLPAYLQEVQGYNSEQVGAVLAWAGLPQLLIIPFIPVLQKHVDARIIVCAGTVIFAASCFMNIHLSADSASEQFMTSNIVRAVGQAIVFAPLSGLAFLGIPRPLSGAASGLFNMMRNLGGAIGTAALATFITRREQFHSNIIGQSVTAYDGTTARFLSKTQHQFLQQNTSDPNRAFREAERLLGDLVRRQANIIAFSDTYLVIGAILLTAALAVLVMRRASPSLPPPR